MLRNTIIAIFVLLLQVSIADGSNLQHESSFKNAEAFMNVIRDNYDIKTLLPFEKYYQARKSYEKCLEIADQWRVSDSEEKSFRENAERSETLLRETFNESLRIINRIRDLEPKYKKLVLEHAKVVCGLTKNGSGYYCNISDENLFQGRNRFVLSGNGSVVLNAIYNIYESFDTASLVIIGHTRWIDRMGLCDFKTGAVVNYFVKEKGCDINRIEKVSKSNTVSIYQGGRSRTLDRVEIVINGVDVE